MGQDSSGSSTIGEGGFVTFLFFFLFFKGLASLGLLFGMPINSSISNFILAKIRQTDQFAKLTPQDPKTQVKELTLKTGNSKAEP